MSPYEKVQIQGEGWNCPIMINVIHSMKMMKKIMGSKDNDENDAGVDNDDDD